MNNKNLKTFITSKIYPQTITIKWLNMGTWERENIKNYQDVINSYNITYKIKKNLHFTDSKYILITLTKGCCILSIMSSYADLERDTANLLKMFFIYLGDKTKMTTRFGTININ